MMLKNIIFGVLVVLVIYLFYIHVYDGTVYVVSNIDNKMYKVRSKKDNKRQADLLAILYDKLSLIVNTLKQDPEYTHNQDVQRLIYNWESGVSIKEVGKMESDAAYVINKKHMSFCLEDKDSFEYYNLMTYVAIHELSHIMSVEVGHGAEFIKNFQFLLNYSKQINWFNPVLGKQEPLYVELNKLNTADNYCGVKLANSIN